MPDSSKESDNKISTTSHELNQLVDQWIAYQNWFQRKTKGEATDADEPAECRDAPWQNTYTDAELMWAFIKCACNRKLPDRLLGDLGAGELEQFLSWYGPDYIDKVEEEAR